MSIYDEAFNDLLKYFHENKPLENIDDTLVKIEHGLERAKKVEELLGLYREKDRLSKNPYKNIDTKEIKPYYEWACELKTLEDKIKALEEVLK